MNVLNLLFKISILQKVVFSQIVERFRSFFEIVDLRPVFISLAFLSLDAVLNINDKRDTFAGSLHLTLAGIVSLNAFLDPFLGVILPDGLSTSETFLAFGSEGDVFAGFDFISGILHQFQELIVVLCRDDISVNGLLEFLFPACSSLGLGVLLIAHALALRGRNYGETVFFAEPVTCLAHIIVDFLVTLVCVMIHKVHGIENQVIMNMVFINMGGQHILILPGEDFIRKLLADLMGKLRRDLANIKGLDDMAGNNFDGIHPLLLGNFSRPFKFLSRCLSGTSIGRDKHFIIGLLRIHDVRKSLVQSSSDCFDLSNCHTSSSFPFSSTTSS